MIRCHVEGLLEQGGIKLTSVASDLFGVSGWAMLEQIAKGEADVEVMVKEARGALRKKEPQLREALAGPVGASLPAIAETAHGSSAIVMAAD